MLLRTLADCDKALKLLDMHREHVLEVRAFLEENGPQLFDPVRPKLQMDQILQIVLDNPGIDGIGVRQMLEKTEVELSPRQVQSALSRLAKSGEIENRGKHGLGSRWYIKER